jgi:hypothetical protein
MPKSAYLICAQSGSQDHWLHGVSFFNILEVVAISEHKPKPDGVLVHEPLRMRVTSAWFKEDADSPDQEFVAQLVALAPGTEEVLITGNETVFKFGNTLIYRITVPQLDFPPVPVEQGFMRFECRLRRVEDSEWTHHQEFSIRIQRIPSSQQEATSPSLVETPTPPAN